MTAGALVGTLAGWAALSWNPTSAAVTSTPEPTAVVLMVGPLPTLIPLTGVTAVAAAPTPEPMVLRRVSAPAQPSGGGSRPAARTRSSG